MLAFLLQAKDSSDSSPSLRMWSTTQVFLSRLRKTDQTKKQLLEACREVYGVSNKLRVESKTVFLIHLGLMDTLDCYKQKLQVDWNYVLEFYIANIDNLISKFPVSSYNN